MWLLSQALELSSIRKFMLVIVMYKFTPETVSTMALFLKSQTLPSFVFGRKELFLPLFHLSMGEFTLTYQRSTLGPKGQPPPPIQYLHFCIEAIILLF